MRLRRELIKFFLILGVVYALVVAPWPGIDRAYLGIFRSVGAAIFGKMGSGGTVQFDTTYKPDREWISVLILRSPNTLDATGIDYKTRYGYLAVGLTLALIIATPVPWRRKWKSLVWGALLAMVFVEFCLWLVLLDAFSDPPLSVFTIEGIWKRVLQQAAEMFSLSPEATFVVPVFIWLLVSFRCADLEQFKNAGTTEIRAKS